MRIPTLVVLTVFLLPLALQADIVIDTFDDGAPLVQVGAGTDTQISTGSGIYGTDRNESLTVRDLGGAESLASLTYGGEFSIGMGSNDQAFGSLLWDGFSNVDFTEAGTNDRFALEVVSNDVDAILSNVMSIRATSGATTVTQGFDIAASSTLPSVVTVSFSDFAGVDFTQLDSVELLFDFQVHPGRDIEFSYFTATAVPEASHLMMLSFAVAGWCTRRRRKVTA